MPELPEVQTVVSDLAEILPGKEIHNAEVFWPKTLATSNPQEFLQYIRGQKIINVSRRAKFIRMHFRSGAALFVHLRMSGQLFWKKQQSQPDKHTRVVLHFTDGSTLVFRDMRKFGRMYFFPNSQEAEKVLLVKTGPEPLEVSAQEFVQIFQERKGSIKTNLLRQDLICGIGNIYADESLFLAKIHPQTATNVLSTLQLKKLYAAIQKILHAAIALRGTSMRSYLDTTGNAGKYKTILKVYQQNGRKCPRCGTIIKKIRSAGRGTHFCPKCQRLP